MKLLHDGKSSVLILALIASAGLAAGCGESREDITTETARAWVDQSIDEVSNTVVELVIGEVPVATQLAGQVLADKIRDNLTWTYYKPRPQDFVRYEITATAAVDFSLDIPLLGERAYVVSLPFNLEVDTDDRTVVSWWPDVLSATVEEREGEE